MNPYRKVNPGEALQIAAATWNRVIDEVATRPRFDGGMREWPPINFSVRCRNDSGAPVSRYSVLQIAGLLETPSGRLAQFERGPGVIGVTPTQFDTRGYVVALEPIEKDAIGMAAIAGAVQCRINVSCNAHIYARPAYGSAAYMQSCESGPFRILWKDNVTPAAPSGVTGPQATGPWALVMFGTEQPLEDAGDHVSTKVQLLGHGPAAGSASGASGCYGFLRWYSVTECSGNPSYATSYFL